MTKDEALRLALEAMEKSEPNKRKGDDDYREIGWMEHREAINAVKATLEAKDEPWEKFCDLNFVWTDHHPDCKLTKDEPVGTAGELFSNTALERLDLRPSTGIYITPLPVAEPHKRTWQSLTDEEIASVEYNNHPLDGIRSFARAIEAKLRSKNYD